MYPYPAPECYNLRIKTASGLVVEGPMRQTQYGVVVDLGPYDHQPHDPEVDVHRRVFIPNDVIVEGPSAVPAPAPEQPS